MKKLLKRIYDWLLRIPPQYDHYRIKARIKIGRKTFKVRARDYKEFLHILAKHPEAKKEV